MIMIVISFVTSLHWLRIVKFQGGNLEIMHMIIEFKEVVSLGISDLFKRYHSLIWDIIIYYLLLFILETSFHSCCCTSRCCTVDIQFQMFSPFHSKKAYKFY